MPDGTLSELRAEFGRSRILAMPAAGAIAWTVVGLAGILLPAIAWLALFICTGMIFPIGLMVARLLGEDLTGAQRENNELDRLFMYTVLMASMVWAIAIPFFMIEKSSLPLSVGILAGLMWIPYSWIVQHWIGLFHGISRTVLVVAAWYLVPQLRYVAIPAVIVIIYMITIFVLATRQIPDPSKPKSA